MTRHLYKLLWHLKEHGPRHAVAVVWTNLAAYMRAYLNERWDRRFHVDTAGIVQLDGLTCTGDKKSAVWYEPTPLRTLQQIPLFLPPDLNDFTFIDFGSGKGRTLLYASHLNFKGIIGVEFAQELHGIAERNIHTFRSREQRCFDIRTVCVDAAEFLIPEGNCVFYFFNPFRGDVMARVLGNLERSYREHPRVFIVLYYNPRAADVFEGVSFLRKCTEVPMPFDLTAETSQHRRSLIVYETVGP
jgi:hypothetical protein